MSRNPNPPCVPKGGFGVIPDKPIILPSWLSEEDVSYYASKFDQKGFTGGLNYYRVMDLYVCYTPLPIFFKLEYVYI